jgi:hypothetical protein
VEEGEPPDGATVELATDGTTVELATDGARVELATTGGIDSSLGDELGVLLMTKSY